MKDFLRLVGDTTVDVKGKLPNTNFDTRTVIQWAIAAAGLVAVGFLIKAGFNYLTSQGDPGKAKKAMNTIIYCVVGLAVVIIAEAIVYFVFNSIGSA